MQWIVRRKPKRRKGRRYRSKIIEAAARLKINPQWLFDLDFYEALDYIKYAQEQYKEEYKIALSLAWKTAIWQRCQKPPKLEDILKEVEETKEPTTPESMFEKVKALHARMGGA